MFGVARSPGREPWRPEENPVTTFLEDLAVTQDPHAFRDHDPAFALHRGGKIEVGLTVPLETREDLSLAYTPGVAKICMAIAADDDLVYDYTWMSRTVAVVTDGTAVLGLGDIGPRAALPVMEGKAMLFKHFGGIDAVPICLDVTDTDELVETIVRLAPAFGGINLEDISAPRCFEVERRVQERLSIPVFHDDQHGTAIVTLAALRNAARLTGRTLADLRVVVSGAGAAGIAVSKMILEAGIGDLAIGDSKGMVHISREDLNDEKRAFAAISNKAGLRGDLNDALAGADVYIGLSSGKVPFDAVASMAKDSIVFSMANPDPEIHPDDARRAGARVIATGRSDFPNQINNVLAFPGVFKGAMEVRATCVTEGMKQAAAVALAACVGEDLHEEHVIPSVFDPQVAVVVAAAVAAAARQDGVARL
jgi:malate dehydrogenase (oxaloacetate-decarboxylating)